MKKHLIIISLLILASGCAVRVPQSSYKFGSAHFKLPKDFTAKNLELQIISGTNTLVFKAASITTINNPNVIAASGEAQIELTKEHYNGAAKLTEKAIEASGKVFIPKP